jgi:hypothetical protein
MEPAVRLIVGVQRRLAALAADVAGERQDLDLFIDNHSLVVFPLPVEVPDDRTAESADAGELRTGDAVARANCPSPSTGSSPIRKTTANVRSRPLWSRSLVSTASAEVHQECHGAAAAPCGLRACGLQSCN